MLHWVKFQVVRMGDIMLQRREVGLINLGICREDQDLMTSDRGSSVALTNCDDRYPSARGEYQ